MEASSTMKKPQERMSAARGQTIVISSMPVRDSGGDAGKKPVTMSGSKTSLSHSISGDSVPAK